MTNSSNSPNSNDQPSPKDNRQWDEFIAVIVALLGIGSIFFWIMLRDNSALSLKSLQIFVNSPPSSQPSASPKVAPIQPTGETQPKLSVNDSSTLEKDVSLPGKIAPSATNQSTSKSDLSSTVIVGINSTAPTSKNLPQAESFFPPVNLQPVTPETSPKTKPETSPTTSPKTSPETGSGAIPKTPTAETVKPLETAKETDDKPVVTTPTTTPPEKFSDVPEDYWAKPAIQSLLTINVVSGFPDGSFRPNEPVTRAELAAQLQKVFEQKAKQKGVKYKDIAADYWAAKAINQVSESGFLRGYPGEIFKPDQQVPRVQVLVALASGLNLNLPSQSAGMIKQYKDAKDIPNYAIQKVAAATQNSLVVNYPDRTLLNPNQPATRAEVAVMIHQALAIAGEVEPLNNSYIVRP
jgi:S-layer homology domain